MRIAQSFHFISCARRCSRNRTIAKIIKRSISRTFSEKDCNHKSNKRPSAKSMPNDGGRIDWLQLSNVIIRGKALSMISDQVFSRTHPGRVTSQRNRWHVYAFAFTCRRFDTFVIIIWYFTGIPSSKWRSTRWSVFLTWIHLLFCIRKKPAEA